MKRFTIGLLISVGLLSGIGLGTWKVLHDKHEADVAALLRKKQDISVTIIEGKRREEIAAQLAAAGVTDYDGFMTASATTEGTLFPDTYRFFPNTPATEVATKLTTTYTSRVSALKPTRDQLILASIVEREALRDADRATIAGVYANRLRIGMAMQADPTVQYAKDSIGYSKTSQPKTFAFWAEISRADYRSAISLFNTYLQTGLPPAPICNPGISSIAAAISPASHDYLFFGYKDDKLLLAKTLEQHEKQLK
jgi:UPF0755 protein